MGVTALYGMPLNYKRRIAYPFRSSQITDRLPWQVIIQTAFYPHRLCSSYLTLLSALAPPARCYILGPPTAPRVRCLHCVCCVCVDQFDRCFLRRLKLNSVRRLRLRVRLRLCIRF